MQILVRTLHGQVFLLDAEPSYTISAIRAQIHNLKGYPPSQQRLIYQGRQLEDSLSLADYEIDSEAVILLVRKEMGGGMNIGLRFSRLNTPAVKGFSREAPIYRTVTRGLNFRSKCENRRCEAYDQVIIVNKGLGRFNVTVEAGTLACPICGNQAKKANNCGFYLAQWRFIGITIGGNRLEIEGRTETRNYHTWKEGEERNWEVLEVEVDPYTP